MAAAALPGEAHLPEPRFAGTGRGPRGGRVAQGGHDVPEDVIRRRYIAGWRNFQQKFKLLVDAWAHYDNSGERPALVEQGSSV